jgi:hypothetical protein
MVCVDYIYVAETKCTVRRGILSNIYKEIGFVSAFCCYPAPVSGSLTCNDSVSPFAFVVLLLDSFLN